MDRDLGRRKRCRDCGITRELEAFPIQRGGRLGRHPVCKLCRAAQERQRYQRERLAILERARTDASRKQRVRWRALERKYGLSKHDHESIWVAQCGCCAVCEMRHPRLVVDHDHRTAEVRGLLCVPCNFAVGELRDDPVLCEAAATYLDRRR